MRTKKKWYDYLWILSLTYLILGFFNILFAWLGLLCFFIPLIISVVKGNKAYCNKYCGRGQLFSLIGGRFGLSRRKDVPAWMRSKYFRYGFLVFFFAMFFVMLWNTWLVFSGAGELKEAVTLLWTFRLPWHWAYHGTLFSPGVAQFAFGFYSVMLTSTVLGLVTMVLFKPRSWCVYCPMGTMTQFPVFLSTILSSLTLFPNIMFFTVLRANTEQYIRSAPRARLRACTHLKGGKTGLDFKSSKTGRTSDPGSRRQGSVHGKIFNGVADRASQRADRSVG